ncbi:SDR family NAD(P)-dependent oxidoreductase [Spirillospora sp. NBC_01491]|uniref:SDR family NAD(P)-dependent oxidoreductase n=1 Tax=Spirillospora sp. NBC_01491 TaxID=2976007 RepID=UPI002E315AE6|nr:SDR family oxidoreductase [Spirillospora sp. NBC_01491]
MSAPRFAGASAIVTGGGSGIGAAIGKALVEAGAHVVLGDLDEQAAKAVAAELAGPGTARGVALDVTDATAVRRLVEEVAAHHGGLDLMFNNAGIFIGGETEQISPAQWNAIIDVNIRGVVHGVTAAYPLMIQQGRGHIVNTASMGGLMAAGLLTGYAMTKHAVVGLSLALRSEAAAHGVAVTAICPAAVDTPILDKGAIGRFHGRDYFLKGQGVRRPLAPDVLARRTLDAVAEGRALLVTPRAAHIAWLIGRLAPGLVQRMSIRFVARQRSMQAARAALPQENP